MNNEQKRYAIKSIEKYRKEEQKADRKGFWQLVVANASLVLIGVATYLSESNVNVIPKDIALGANVLLGVIGLTTFGESIRNNSKSNAAEANANALNDLLSIGEKYDDEEEVVYRRKK